MSETKIDFVPQTYPLYVPVMPHLPWLPPMEGEGLWQAELAELTDEALADEIGGLLSVYPVIGWRVSPQAVVPVTPADQVGIERRVASRVASGPNLAPQDGDVSAASVPALT